MSEILETESIPCSFTAIFEVALYYPELKQQLFYNLPHCLPADVSSFWKINLMSFLKLEILNFLLEDQLRNITPNASLSSHCGKRLTVCFIQHYSVFCKTPKIF